MEEIQENKNKVWFNNTIFFFIGLILFTFIFSIIGDALNWEGTYFITNNITGALDSKLISVESLFSREGLRYLIGSVVSNFINFKPLAMFLFIMIGVGFAEKTGLFSSLFEKFGKKISKFWLTFLVVLISILSNIIGEVAFTLIIPVSAILFLVCKRNPMVAIFASFVGITAGSGINFITSQLDFDSLNSILIGAKLIDPTYTINLYGNLFFEVVGTIGLAFLITFITEKFTSRRLAKYKIDEVLIEEEIQPKKKKKALLLCGIVSLLLILFFVYMLIPTGAPLSGLLLDYDVKDPIARIFSPNSYVAEGLSFVLLSILLICGWMFGNITGTMKNSKGIPTYLYNSLNNIGGVLILLFLASQLIALFEKSNIGTVFTIWVANFIENLNFSAIPLIFIFFILVLLVNIINPSAISKISVLGPILTPEFMKANVTPEFMQVVYKLAGTTSDIITPLFPYFIVFLGMILIYGKKNDELKIKEVYKGLFPYFIGITLFWMIYILCWYIINIPMGIGIYPIL